MSAEEYKKPWVVSNLVQIKAENEEEVQRRIEAFINNKRSEVDERNIREFINPFSAEPGGGCARTEAVYYHREGQKSHISLKRVENAYGPQTRLVTEKSGFRHVPVDRARAEAVEERLANMEAHLNMEKGGHGIFMRLKSLEKRISFLEELSPEYFAYGVPSAEHNNFKKTDIERVEKGAGNIKHAESLADVQSKILKLKQALKQRLEKQTDLKT